jgi:hypothetical protein
MFNVTVSENGRLVDKIEFDEQNIAHYDGGVAIIHRDVMQSCGHNGIWYRVAHAAGIVAERGSLLDAMEAMTKEAIQRLFERLQTGWQPKADEIDRELPQLDLFDWQFAPAFERSEAVVIGYDADGRLTRSDQIIWIDAALRWALCESAGGCCDPAFDPGHDRRPAAARRRPCAAARRALPGRHRRLVDARGAELDAVLGGDLGSGGDRDAASGADRAHRLRARRPRYAGRGHALARDRRAALARARLCAEPLDLTLPIFLPIIICRFCFATQ